MKAKVFLLDYGSTIDRVDMTTNVRHLKPTKELSQDPLAFKIILAGLYPVSMDIDWDLPSEVSMQQSRSPHSHLTILTGWCCRKRYWDGSAMKLVKRVVGLCNGLGILRDASSPSSTRRVGTLIMCKTSSSRDQINLNKLLEDKKFADYSQFEVEMDHNSVDQGYGVESTDFSSDEEDVVIRNSDPLLNVPHMTIQQKIANHYRERNNNDDSFSSTDSSKAGPSLRARKSLQKKGAEGNVADQLKESLRSVSDEVTKKEEAQEEVQEEDDIWSKFREEKKEVKGHMIPGGVFLGKRHENILARIKSSNEQELREKFTKLVTKK